MADKQAYSTVSVRLTAEEKKKLENTQTKLNTLNQQLSELKENYVSAILSGNDDVALQIKTQYQTLLNGE